MNSVNFLKKYSTIPNHFIDDFYQIFDVDNSNNINGKFKIDLDLCAKWLNSRKGNIKDTLINSYHENIDYITTTNLTVNQVGRPIIKIFLTTDCFKRLCLLSRTYKAEQVRSYYLQLEELVDKYKNFIIDGLNGRIGILENNQRPIIDTQSGVIYVFEVKPYSDDLVKTQQKYKIGKARNIKARMSSHNSSHADNVNILFIYEVDDIDRVENCLKAIIKPYQYRKRKEIYEIGIDTLKDVIKSCGDIINRVENNESNQEGGDRIVYAIPIRDN